MYENVNDNFHLCQDMACRQKFSKTSQMTQYGRTWLREIFLFFHLLANVIKLAHLFEKMSMLNVRIFFLYLAEIDCKCNNFQCQM